MLICAFSPHYQLIYINFDISSFSVISYLLTTNIQHKNIGIATQWYFSLAVYIYRRDSGKKFIGRCTGGGYVWAYIENPALRIDRQLAFLPSDDHFLKQLGVLCKFYFSKIYLRIPYCDFTFLCDTLNISGKYPLSYNWWHADKNLRVYLPEGYAPIQNNMSACTARYRSEHAGRKWCDVCCHYTTHIWKSGCHPLSHALFLFPNFRNTII